MDVQAYADRLAIEDVIMTYFRGVHAKDYALVRSCFTEDAHIDYQQFFSGDVDEFIAYLAALPQDDRQSFPFAGNRLVEVDGGDVAHAELYAITQHATTHPDGEISFMAVWMRYFDRFERRDGGWKLASRNSVIEWVREDTAGMWADLPR